MHLFQSHPKTALLCLALYSRLPLAAQPAANPLLAPIQVETGVITTTVKQAAENSVTLQELSHSVPARARREMEKGLHAFGKHIDQEALVHLLRAVATDPEYVAARNNLAVVYLSMGNPDAAVSQLRAAVRLDSYRAILFNNLAVSHWMVNQYSEAEFAARTALRLLPSLDSARAILGMSLFQQRKFTDEALRYLSPAGADYPFIRLMCARILLAQGRGDVARAEIQKYLSSGVGENRGVAERWLEAIDHPHLAQEIFADR